jgi:soluble lytic murein transglycosylase-like protein
MATEEELMISQLEQQIAEEQRAIAALTPATTATANGPLSWWERGQQRANTPGATIPSFGIFPSMTQDEYKQSWSAEGLRRLPEEALSISGSVAGGALGAALAPATGGMSLLAPVIGSAIGSYADVPVQMGLDYLTGQTPSTSRLGQATEEAATGAVVETGLRGLGVLGKAAAPFASRQIARLADYLGPQTTEAAQALVGREMGKIAPQEALERAVAQREALAAAGPAAESLTTAELTGLDKAAQAERLLATQPAGDANITFAKLAQEKLDDLNKTATSLTGIADPNPKRAGEAAKTLLKAAEKAENKSANALFTDEVKAIKTPVKGLARKAKELFITYFPASDINTASSDLLGQYKKLIAKTKPKAKLEKGEVHTVSIGDLQELRSSILKLGRTAEKGSRDETFAKGLANVLEKQIDQVEGTESLAAARSAWREYKQRWFYDANNQRAPLSSLLRKQNPEDIISAVSKKSAVSDEYAKVLGALEPNKLASEMTDFTKKETVDAKLKWIQDKRAVYADSPIWPIVQQWEQVLLRTKDAAKKGNVDALSPRNIDIQASSLVRALGGAERQVAASPAEASALSAGANLARSGVTGALGGTTAGTLFGIGLPYVRGKIDTSTNLVASTLAEALQDPAAALKYMQGAGDYVNPLITAAAAKGQSILSALDSLAPRAGAFARSIGIFDPKMQTVAPVATPLAQSLPTPTTNVIDSDIAEIERQILELQQPEATPAPTDMPVAKQEISMLADEAAAKYDVAPSLVKAVIQAESSFKPNAVSKVGAQGLMQLMPKTAESLGVTDPFDPAQNIEGGVKYLAQLIKKFGSEDLALAAYNWGEGRIRNQLNRLERKGKPQTLAAILKYGTLPEETQNYLTRINKVKTELV